MEVHVKDWISGGRMLLQVPGPLRHLKALTNWSALGKRMDTSSLAPSPRFRKVSRVRAQELRSGQSGLASCPGCRTTQTSCPLASHSSDQLSDPSLHTFAPAIPHLRHLQAATCRCSAQRPRPSRCVARAHGSPASSSSPPTAHHHKAAPLASSRISRA